MNVLQQITLCLQHEQTPIKEFKKKLNNRRQKEGRNVGNGRKKEKRKLKKTRRIEKRKKYANKHHWDWE